MLANTESPVSTGSLSHPISISSEPGPAEMLSGGLVASVFLKAVRAAFFDDLGAPTYPGVPPAAAVAKIMQEFPEALVAMLTVLEDGGEFPANPAPKSAVARVIAAATASGWPNESTVPDDWSASFPKFRRYELVSAMNIMMQAFHHSGVAGGTTGFPPEKP